MSNDLKDILANSNKDIDNQQLMDYLSNQLSKQELHDVEKAMSDDPFVNDAVEGLQEMQHQQKIAGYVEQLNHELQKQIAKNKLRKEKRRWKESPYNYAAIAVLLLLLIICFITVKKYLQRKNNLPVTRTAFVQQHQIKILAEKSVSL